MPYAKKLDPRRTRQRSTSGASSKNGVPRPTTVGKTSAGATRPGVTKADLKTAKGYGAQKKLVSPASSMKVNPLGTGMHLNKELGEMPPGIEALGHAAMDVKNGIFSLLDSAAHGGVFVVEKKIGSNMGLGSNVLEGGGDAADAFGGDGLAGTLHAGADHIDEKKSKLDLNANYHAGESVLSLTESLNHFHNLGSNLTNFVTGEAPSEVDPGNFEASYDDKMIVGEAASTLYETANLVRALDKVTDVDPEAGAKALEKLAPIAVKHLSKLIDKIEAD